MEYKRKNFSIKNKNGCKTFFWTIPYKNNPKKRYLWLNYSNTKEQERIRGNDTCNNKYHFSLDITYIISINTVNVGKKIFNSRLNLLQLFKKDYSVYTTGEGVSSC